MARRTTGSTILGSRTRCMSPSQATGPTAGRSTKRSRLSDRRLLRLLKVCVEVDGVSVGVAQLRVAHAPEGVPRGLVPPSTRLLRLGIELVDFLRVGAPENKGRGGRA